MSVFDFLQPINSNLVSYAARLSGHSMGAKITLHTASDFPNLDKIQLAIIGVLDARGGNISTQVNLDAFRTHFYALFPGNWQLNLADLGDIEMGDSQNDTYFAVNNVVSGLIKKNIIPIVIGGSQDITYAMYRAYDRLDQMVNFVNIDKRFDLENSEFNQDASAFVHKMILEMPNNLFHYANIGFQIYLNSQEEIDLMEKLYFESYRLGEVSNDLSITEPVFRDADLVSVDLTSIKSMESSNFVSFMPNGFDGKEICSLVRYAGISDRVSAIGFFNTHYSDNEFVLLSQVVWYFLEGFYHRSSEYPFDIHKNVTKYTVLIDSEEMVFYKSNLTERWWMEMLKLTGQDNNRKITSLLPCSYGDYLKACNQEIPERWWKAQRKSLL